METSSWVDLVFYSSYRGRK